MILALRLNPVNNSSYGLDLRDSCSPAGDWGMEKFGENRLHAIK